MYHHKSWLLDCKLVELVFVANNYCADVNPILLAAFLAVLELYVAPLNVLKRDICAKQHIKLCFAKFFVVLTD